MSLFLYVLASQHTMRTFISSVRTKNYHSLAPADTTSTTQSAAAGSECSKRLPSTTTVRSRPPHVDYTPQEVKYLLDSVCKYGRYTGQRSLATTRSTSSARRPTSRKISTHQEEGEPNIIGPVNSGRTSVQRVEVQATSILDGQGLVHGVKIFGGSDWRMILSTYSFHARTARQLRHRFRVLEAHHRGQGQWRT